MTTKVLVAEDEMLIAMDVIDELGSAGFVIIGPFAKFVDALDYCRREPPDCAVLDVRLADGESFPVADWLADHGVPVVFHSSHAQDTLLRRYRGSRVCPKPAPASLLANIVADICQTRARLYAPA